MATPGAPEEPDVPAAQPSPPTPLVKGEAMAAPAAQPSPPTPLVKGEAMAAPAAPESQSSPEPLPTKGRVVETHRFQRWLQQHPREKKQYGSMNIAAKRQLRAAWSLDKDAALNALSVTTSHASSKTTSFTRSLFGIGVGCCRTNSRDTIRRTWSSSKCFSTVSRAALLIRCSHSATRTCLAGREGTMRMTFDGHTSFSRMRSKHLGGHRRAARGNCGEKAPCLCS